MVAANYKISYGLDIAGPVTATTGSFSGLLTGSSGLTISGSTILGPTSHTGAASFGSSGLFTGSLTAGGGLSVAGNATFAGATSFSTTGQFSGLLTAGGGLGVIGNATISGALVVGGAQTINGAITANGGVNATTLNATGPVTFNNTTPVFFNGLGNLSSGDGASTLHLVNPAGGDVVLAFESSAKYGLKLGINNIGDFYMGGWSDGASTFRMVVDHGGNLTLKGNTTTSYVTVANGITSNATIIGKGNYVLRPTAAGNQQSYIFQDVSGNNLGYLSQVNGTVFLTATGNNSSNITLDGSGNVRLNGNGNLTTGADVQCASLAVTGGGITLGTVTGNGGNAGQVTYSNGNITLYSQTASLYLTNTGKGYIGTSGTVAQLISTTPSASALKENVVAHTQTLNKIQKLPVVRYNYTEASGLDPSETHVGFIAEDVQKHVPHAYTEIEGTPSIFLTKFVPDLWMGVQHLIDWNNGLEKKLAAQTKRYDRLLERIKALEDSFIN